MMCGHLEKTQSSRVHFLDIIDNAPTWKKICIPSLKTPKYYLIITSSKYSIFLLKSG